MPRATLELITKEGFSALVTVTAAMTNSEVKDLMDKVDLASIKAKEAGFSVGSKGRSTYSAKPATSQTVAVSTPSTPAVPMNSEVCSIHGVAMYEKTGQYGPYFSHFDKVEGYCNGKGWKKQTYKKY